MSDPDRPIPLLVFSDLDGTLLDHASYDWSPARPAMRRLLAIGGGCVLATSKTAAEVIPLRAAMGLEAWPAIVENGAGVIAPGAKAQGAGDDYLRLRDALDALPDALRASFTGFGDLDAQGVAEVTGLSFDAATQAKRRLFSEPGTWSGSDADREEFIGALARAGVQARMGGRFLTLSFGRTKADAMAEVTNRLAPLRTMALGDAPNDAEMIASADIGVIIPNPHGSALPDLPGETEGRIRRAPHPGPEGWNITVGQVIDELDLSQNGARHG
ncbi:HAD-IIB family hydrolase [Maritimibacter sp. UBA3975]|uniref:HAD-IIB family hydrolase n=1 Tax=Maritimibacter sp. UBA3975 TaxID=1946833 RepID=UPI000C09A130|nr:HAD-IIB family hydrolase [Maritimibacter sp. UBA3975]MAM60765.1 mannosyl-3-phosphoglycerate phosphatase [Maritimibacter sp.]